MEKWIEILIRSAALFIVLLLFIRVMGKRNISRMNAFSFVSYVIIAIISALISVNIITNITFGFIALAVWIVFTIAVDYLSIKSKKVHDLIHGKEAIIIKNGKIMEETLLQLRLSGEELLKELRNKSVFNVADVEFAIMETSGELNVLLKSDKQTITPKDLQQKVSPKSESQTVILDGTILNEPLFSLGLNQRWLKIQLENLGVSLDNVFLGQVDSSGELYVDLFDDSIQIPEPKVKELVYANLEKTHADFMKFSLETQDEVAKKMYARNAEIIKDLTNKLEPYLLR